MHLGRRNLLNPFCKTRKQTTSKKTWPLVGEKNYCVLQEKRGLLCSSVSIEFKSLFKKKNNFKKIHVKLRSFLPASKDDLVQLHTFRQYFSFICVRCGISFLQVWSLFRKWLFLNFVVIISFNFS